MEPPLRGWLPGRCGGRVPQKRAVRAPPWALRCERCRRWAAVQEDLRMRCARERGAHPSPSKSAHATAFVCQTVLKVSPLFDWPKIVEVEKTPPPSFTYSLSPMPTLWPT